MSPLRKIGAFTAALAAAFGAAYGIGGAVAPVDAGRAQEAAHASMTDDGGHAEPGSAAAHTPGGLQVSERGYTLDLETTSLPAGARTTLRFVVRDAQGAPVTAYRTEHGKQLHLVLAARELTAYRHLHPARAADGTWSVPVELPEAGGYRVFADFTPAAAREGLTLGSDLAVTGRYAARALPAAARTATVDGYTVRLDGTLTPGRESDLTFTVSRAGRPVTALQPYLGAYGHLVALRSGDLAYLHVHPHEEARGTTVSGPEVAFTATAPSTGTYRLFLDFEVGGRVHTASFTAATGTHGH
ncbi:hypothetical protein [Streptomyces galbus]|uniref:DUF748 domain-containing protein n=1 Tax=Streptomyces galbus TaxID=33898 RepID=A0A4U5W8Z6_STRGB|nr:hypothetical protein [Streptomyces galbus]TKS98093.1 hypothetical protein E4U92_31070 [Streptomyces galbus]GHD43723.1 hypothetical protein GCM10010335_47640 [Streptomyces galbus]